MIQPSHKVSLSLPADLVAWIDRQVARKRGGTRSGVVEQAVRSWARRAAAKDIEDATAAYYQAMTSAEQEEDDTWSRLGGSTWRSEDD
jgi:Arc/MetJ-type ribon-helix-helix transcriptional regulator